MLKRDGVSPWFIIVADDEENMREVISLSLESLLFEGASIHVLQASNGEDVIGLLRQNPETAIVFMDVVMTTPDDGLVTAGKIRNFLGMNEVRIILNTAQGSTLPKLDAIRNYGINDFQYKSELSLIRLQALVLTNLRNYQDLVKLKTSEVLSSRVIQTANRIQSAQTLVEISTAVINGLAFLTASVAPKRPQPYPDGFLAQVDEKELTILSGIGKFEHKAKSKHLELIDQLDRDTIETVLEKQRNIWSTEYIAFLFRTEDKSSFLVYLRPENQWDELVLNQTRIYLMRIPASFDRITLIQNLKERQNELTHSLEERDALLKEIHHRVKNNLQIISSLLSIESSEDFSNTRDRIHSMALVHEQLYRSSYFAELELGNYLWHLCQDIGQAFHITGRMVYTPPENDVIIPFEKAIPIGLMVNELITNAAKYAYTETQEGSIRVSLFSGHPIRLVVQDDGKGRSSMDAEQQSGIQLAELLASQIHGKITELQGTGTGYEVEIP